MSFYPANQNSNVFNADDFLSQEEVNETTTSTNNDVNMEEYMKKSGSVMSGTLQVPQLFISDTNSLAYSTSEKTKLDDNTSKLVNVSKTATHTEISDLKCDEIQFQNTVQTQAFTDNDKTQISINQGKTIYINNTVSEFKIDTSTNDKDIIINPGLGNISLESDEIHFGNPANTNCQIHLNGEVQEKAFTNIKDQNINDLLFITSGITYNSGNTNILNLEVNEINFSGNIDKQNYPFTDNDRTQISTNAGNIINLQNKTNPFISEISEFKIDTSTNDKDIIINPGFGNISLESDEIHFGNPANTNCQIHLNGEIQNHAYINEDHSHLNDLKASVEINNITNQLTLSSGLFSDESIILKTNKLDIKGSSAKIEMNGEIQNHCFTDADHSLLNTLGNLNDHSDVIDVNNTTKKLTLTSGINGNQKLEINSETLFLKKLAVSYGEIGLKDTSTDMNIISYGRDIVLETVGNGFNIIINSDALNLNGSLVMNNETQNYSFTDTRKENLDYLMSGKIRHKHNFGWELLNFTPSNYTSYNGEKFYNVLTPTSEFSNGDRWIGGTKYISLKFNIRFKILNSLIRRFETRFQVFRQYDPSNPNQSLIKEESFYTGYYHYGNGMDFHHTLTLNDTFDMLVEDGDLILLQTKYDMAMNTTPGYAMNCNVFITEY